MNEKYLNNKIIEWQKLNIDVYVMYGFVMHTITLIAFDRNSKNTLYDVDLAGYYHVFQSDGEYMFYYLYYDDFYELNNKFAEELIEKYNLRTALYYNDAYIKIDAWNILNGN